MVCTEQESLARGNTPCTHKHILFLVSDNFFDQKNYMEEVFLGSPKDNLHLGVIPMSLDWMWHYEVGSMVASCLLRGIYHFIIWIF